MTQALWFRPAADTPATPAGIPATPGDVPATTGEADQPVPSAPPTVAAAVDTGRGRQRPAADPSHQDGPDGRVRRRLLLDELVLWHRLVATTQQLLPGSELMDGVHHRVLAHRPTGIVLDLRPGALRLHLLTPPAGTEVDPTVLRAVVAAVEDLSGHVALDLGSGRPFLERALASDRPLASTGEWPPDGAPPSPTEGAAADGPADHEAPADSAGSRPVLASEIAPDAGESPGARSAAGRRGGGLRRLLGRR